ncbi:hypothetical protein BpHYR1_041587 [Brachionus plicatilis]|uniref:Uncharacterized protein n=1 Tax=Brachionus plicatilis TaxID=10195 RepID=A0A3M7SRH3_BRAPC|nr:hypothetical protein BpHYR1_041587 [Brachionus plicatilis]
MGLGELRDEEDEVEGDDVVDWFSGMGKFCWLNVWIGCEFLVDEQSNHRFGKEIRPERRGRRERENKNKSMELFSCDLTFDLDEKREKILRVKKERIKLASYKEKKKNKENKKSFNYSLLALINCKFSSSNVIFKFALKNFRH